MTTITTRADQTTRTSASPLCVRPVRGRRDRSAFLRFPWTIYCNDAAWVPPLLWERREFLSPHRHPFHKHGQAEQFLAFRGSEVVGCILASIDPVYNAQQKTAVGCFGMFEAIDDEHVTSALIDCASEWLADRGCDTLRGPIDYSMNYACGLLVEGFDTPPRIMMNHHPPYYAARLEGAGLEKAKDLYAWWFDDPLDMVQRWLTRAEKLMRRMEKYSGVKIRSIRMNDIDRDILRFKQAYNEVLESHWGLTKMTDAEFEHFSRSLRQFAVPELILLAEVGDRPVGISMTFPDINEAIRPLNGRLFPWGVPIGLARFMRNRRRIKTGRMAVHGVSADYRGRGISELLILRTLDYGKNTLGYAGAELGWTLEDNDAINSTIETVGGRLYKRYRIYEKAIG